LDLRYFLCAELNFKKPELENHSNKLAFAKFGQGGPRINEAKTPQQKQASIIDWN
jgi:hypothetical protein